jgi:Electron transfer DM13
MRLLRDMRRWELAPEAGLVLGLGLFAVTEPSAALSAFHSGRAVALMLGAAATWIIGRVVVVRFIRWPALRLVVFSAAALAILKVVVFPAYQNETVVEALPVRTAAGPMPAPLTTVPVPSVSAAPAPLRSGPLHGIDHRASGTASLYRLPGGPLTVGLEQIDIQPGPDYDVYVVPGAGRRDKAGGTRLDDLRGNRGTQYYAVPTGVAADEGAWTVLVWCQTFGVPVAAATPSD